MMKCNVTICGVVSKAATCRTNKEGKPFVTFSVAVVIPAKYRAQNEAYMCRSAKNAVIGLCFSVLSAT